MAEFVGPGREVAGIAQIVQNLGILEGRLREATIAAAEEIAHLLANEAKSNHGETAREGRFVYPGGGVKRWRPAGKGWGDVTGATQTSTKGLIAEITHSYVLVALTTGTDYSKFLELAQKGKWAWLWPAVVRSEQKIMAIWQHHLQAAMVI